MKHRHLDDGADNLIDLARSAGDSVEEEAGAGAREDCEQHLLRLDRALLYSSAETDEDWVFLPGGLDGQEDFRVAGVEQVQSRRRAERVWARALAMARETSAFAAAGVEAHVRWLGFCRRGEVLARMQALSARLEALDAQLAPAVA